MKIRFCLPRRRNLAGPRGRNCRREHPRRYDTRPERPCRAGPRQSCAVESYRLRHKKTGHRRHTGRRNGRPARPLQRRPRRTKRKQSAARQSLHPPQRIGRYRARSRKIRVLEKPATPEGVCEPVLEKQK